MATSRMTRKAEEASLHGYSDNHVHCDSRKLYPLRVAAAHSIKTGISPQKWQWRQDYSCIRNRDGFHIGLKLCEDRDTQTTFRISRFLTFI